MAKTINLVRLHNALVTYAPKTPLEATGLEAIRQAMPYLADRDCTDWEDYRGYLVTHDIGDAAQRDAWITGYSRVEALLGVLPDTLQWDVKAIPPQTIQHAM